MQKEYQVIESSKVGLFAEDGYVVVRGDCSYLRILGAEPKWEVMTATADEDHGLIAVCPDLRRLVQAALLLCNEMGGDPPRVDRDRLGREYVKICTITRNPGETDAAFDAANDDLYKRFLAKFDGLEASNDGNDMRGLYGAMHNDDGEDVYLYDGMWLSSDGSLHDRGR